MFFAIYFCRRALDGCCSAFYFLETLAWALADSIFADDTIAEICKTSFFLSSRSRGRADRAGLCAEAVGLGFTAKDP
jgi:hypothetical protein